MITENLINFATNLIATLGYPGIFTLMATESLMVPFPPEVTLVFSGFLASTGKLNVFLVIICAVLGALLGSSISYWIGYHFKKTILQKLLDKNGHFLFITHNEYVKTQTMLKKHGPWMITVARFVPGLRSIVSLPMGILHVPYVKFLQYTFLGSLGSSSLLVALGYALGDRWQQVRNLVHKLDIAILAIGILTILVYIYKKNRHA